MIIIKKLTRENWRNYKGCPADIVVQQGGDEVWPGGRRRIGIVQYSTYRFHIEWSDGEFGYYCESIGEMVEKFCGSISFFYIEINNAK